MKEPREIAIRITKDGGEWVVTMTIDKVGVSFRRPLSTPLSAVIKEAAEKCEGRPK